MQGGFLYMAWTDNEVSEFILTRLGSPKRVVEVTPEQISVVLKRACRKYCEVKPNLRKDFVTILAGVQAYDLKALGKPYGKGIISVYPQPTSSPADAFSEFDFYRIRTPHVRIGDLVADQVYHGEIARVTGTEFSWHWDHASKKLLISPSPNRSYSLAYDYNLDASTIEEIPEYEQGWVVDFTLALVKEILGRVRGKFRGVPGNDLNIETDYSELLSEGQEEQRTLLETLKDSRGDWVAPIRG